MSDAESPLEPFKRATTATMRALAEDDELEVSFGPGTASARGNRMRVPLPNVGASEAEINAVRGMGDQMALRQRHHDGGLHARFMPQGGPAQEMFEWIEDARIAAIGSARMEGVARNLEAQLESQCKQAAFDTITTETEAPLSVAVGLLVRESLTGRELPPSAENVVRFWRDHIQAHAGEHIEALKGKEADQAEFAAMCRSIIADLGLAADLDEPPDGDTNEEDIETLDENQEAETEFNPEDVVLDDESMSEESADGDATMMEMEADMDMDDAGAEAVARAVAAREAALTATAAVSGRIVVSSRLPDGAPPPPPLAASSGARAPPDASPTLRLRQLQGGGLPGELDGEGSFLLG